VLRYTLYSLSGTVRLKVHFRGIQVHSNGKITSALFLRNTLGALPNGETMSALINPETTKHLSVRLQRCFFLLNVTVHDVFSFSI